MRGRRAPPLELWEIVEWTFHRVECLAGQACLPMACAGHGQEGPSPPLATLLSTRRRSGAAPSACMQVPSETGTLQFWAHPLHRLPWTPHHVLMTASMTQMHSTYAAPTAAPPSSTFHDLPMTVHLPSTDLPPAFHRPSTSLPLTYH